MSRKDRDNYFRYDEQPIDQQVGERRKRVKAAWRCEWRYHGMKRFMEVVVDYEYDGGSIPRPGWTLLGILPSGQGDGGFLPHDVLYRAKGGKLPEKYEGCTVVNENGNAVIVSRREADWVMKAGLLYDGIPARRAVPATGVVRALGWYYWGKPMPYKD